VSFANGKFGLLTIRKEIAPDIFYCDCECGNELTVWRSLLANDIQKDCGMCRVGIGAKGLHRTSHHGHIRGFKTRDGRNLQKRSREYNSWASMISRCRNKKHHAYDTYGGRGIQICERWTLGNGQGFKNFLEDMGPRPSGYTLDRKDPQGHYEPLNCQWADKDTQSRNRRPQLYPDGVPPIQDYIAMEKRLEEELGVLF
jgi:hypothetical protein